MEYGGVLEIKYSLILSETLQTETKIISSLAPKESWFNVLCISKGKWGRHLGWRKGKE